MSHVSCHLSLTPTATAPTPANSPTMHAPDMQKVQKLPRMSFLGNNNFAPKTRKPKLQLIITTMRFSLQDFHKVKNFHKLKSLRKLHESSLFLLIFVLQYLLKVNTFHKNHFTCGNKYLSTLFFFVFLLENFCKWHLRHLPLFTCLLCK